MCKTDNNTLLRDLGLAICHRRWRQGSQILQSKVAKCKEKKEKKASRSTVVDYITQVAPSLVPTLDIPCLTALILFLSCNVIRPCSNVGIILSKNSTVGQHWGKVLKTPALQHRWNLYTNTVCHYCNKRQSFTVFNNIEPIK